MMFAAVWEEIRGYPLERRPRRVAANLLLDTLHLTLEELGRESAWRAVWLGNLDTDRSAAPEEIEGDVDGLLGDAVRACAISSEEAEVILSSRIDGVPLADLARSAGVSYNTMKLRRQRAERRLLLFLGFRPVPRGQQNRPSSLARVAGVGHRPSRMSQRPIEIDEGGDPRVRSRAGPEQRYETHARPHNRAGARGGAARSPGGGCRHEPRIRSSTTCGTG